VPLHIAVVLSLVFHLAAYTLGDWLGLQALPAPPPRPLIEAMLILPGSAAPPPAEPPEPVPEPAPMPPVAVPPAPTVAPPAAVPPGPPQATLQPRPPVPPPLFYPAAAVLRGLEGEVLVRVTLDAGGNVVAARLERGSGHAILDEAALVAAGTLRSLPGSGEAVLPVRFRLR
jgi:protein TonB